MKTNDTTPMKGKKGFTLVELIGVMAIMAILATVMTPNILHSIERAAVKAEADSLNTLATEAGLYMRDNKGAMPIEGPGNWNVQLATYSSLNAADILTNKRQMARLYVVDPVAANYRAMIISSMRYQVALPSLANAKANFTAIWNTAENTVPSGAGWGAWGAGPSPPLHNIEYLVIERVNLAPVQKTYFAQYDWTLNNASTSYSVSCVATWADGSAATTYPLAKATTFPIVLSPPRKLKPGDRLSFYTSATAGMVFSYVVSDSGRTFTYNTSTYWTAQ